jgi:hypothetical protein
VESRLDDGDVAMEHECKGGLSRGNSAGVREKEKRLSGEEDESTLSTHK